MNAKLISTVTAFLMIGFVATTAYSDEVKPPAESHEQHHPDAKAAPKTDAGTPGDQDGMMEKCEKQMGKGECQKMMKQAKGKSRKK